MRRAIYIVIILLAVFSAAFADKKKDDKKQTSESKFQVVVSVVDLDVVALDKNGAPVTDLKPDEIKVWEDGKTRPVKAVNLRSAEIAAADSTAYAARVKQALATLPPGVATNMTSMPTLLQQPVCTVVLFDTLNSPSQAAAIARRQLMDMLKQFDTSQPVAVYGLSNRLVLLQDFTTKGELLKKAIQDLNAPGQQSQHTDIVDHTFSDTFQASVGDMPGTAAIVERLRSLEFDTASETLSARITTTAAALQALATRLQGIPGRKNLVWVTGMFPEMLFPDNNAGTGDYKNSRSNPELYGYLSDTSLALQNARISIYPVDSGGLQNRTWSTDSDQHVTNLFTKYVPGQTGSAAPNANLESGEAHNAMERIASLTGGRAYYDRNDLDKAIASAIQEGSTYYAVSFTPEEKVADGRLHSVKVQTTRKGVNLRYRGSFLEVDPAAQAAADKKNSNHAFHTAMIGQRSLSTGILFFAQRSKTSDDGIDVLIDPRSVNLAQFADGTFHLTLDVAVLAFDGSDKLLNSGGMSINFPVTEEQRQTLTAHGVRFKAPLPLEKGTKRLRVGIRDEATGRIGTVDLTVD